MKIIVTGGAGFIGSNFIIYMLNKYPQYQIICLDKLTYAGHLFTLNTVKDNSNFSFVQIDICDKVSIYSLFEQERPDMVVNFAAESHVDRSIKNPSLFLQTNVLGSQILMDACREFNVSRYHQISTDEVYGDLKNNPSSTEMSPIFTSSPYSFSKASADLLALSYYRTYNFPVTISRCSNNYGPYQYPEKLIPVMITNALQNKNLPVYGNGTNIRDWIYVEDHCRALDIILHKGKIGEIYNIGGNNQITNIEIVKHICNYLQKSQDLIIYVSDRLGHDTRYSINIEKMQNEFNWTPKIEFFDGLNKTIDWYLNNEEWWKTVLLTKERK